MMTIGSLFSGTGMLDYGCHKAGLGETVWHVEADPYRRKVLRRHWPHSRIHDNVKTFRTAEFTAPDIIVGGFPCKDISVANQAGRGLDGKKSGLWFEMLRIISEAKPKGILIENVARLVRRGLDVVIRGLYELGYQVEGTRIRAEDVGAPHRRERLFLVAWLDNANRNRWAKAGQSPEAGGAVANAYGSRQSQPQGVDANIRGWAGNGGELANTCSNTIREQFWRSQTGSETARHIRHLPRPAKSGVARVLNGGTDWLDCQRWPAARGPKQHPWEPLRTIAPRSLPHRPKRAAALGDGVVPQCAFIAARRLMWRLEND